MKRFKPAIWFCVCLLLGLAAVSVWRSNLERRMERSSQRAAAPRSVAPQPAPSVASAPSAPKPRRAATAAVSVRGHIPASKVDAQTARFHATDSRPHRLSNTRRAYRELERRDTAILLRNAVIDTDETLRGLPIPNELQAGEEAGTWLVQARQKVTPAFLKLLRASGARFSEASYIPNNTYIVRGERNVIDLLRHSPLVQAAIPYEPYYKLDPVLLGHAVERMPPPIGGRLRLTLFPGEREKTLENLENLGAQILAEEGTPFGPSVIVQPDIARWTELAMMPEVQGVERHLNKVLLNDLTRTYVLVSTNTTSTDQYLGLTGTNVLVWVNDGDNLDIHHPDLTTNRAAIVPTLAGTNDTGGHATFVAGIIASSGDNSPAVTVNAQGVSSIPGSTNGANFRGMAPEASIIMMDFDNLFLTDADLLEIPARSNLFLLQKTNTLIINNSWGYDGSYTYDTAAAIVDARARDAIPALPGLQQTLPVFAAGNDGNGLDSGQGGLSDGINSPATAKNAITVGASEHLRRITNEFQESTLSLTNTCMTNMSPIYLGRTDSSNQVAAFSSRGNVDPRDEGEYGRWKPDVVAPGSFPVSLRSSMWNHTNRYTANNVDFIDVLFTNITVDPNTAQTFANFLPFNATNLYIDLRNRTPSSFPLLIHTNNQPDPSFTPGNEAAINSTNIPIDTSETGPWYIDVENTNAGVEIEFDIFMRVTITNCAQPFDMILSNLNENVGTHGPPQGEYRFATGGTSYSAPVVSGMLALLQDFFEGTNVLTDPNLRRTNSAAMMKALLINSARSLGTTYDYDMESQINYQGWGLPSIRRMIGEVMVTEADDANWPIQMRDIGGTNSLATDFAHAYAVDVNPAVTNVPLRVTLTWSDPPGNPNAARKLVNDLDVILSNNVTGEIYRGNTYDGDGEYSKVVGATNDFIDPVTGMPIPTATPTNDVVNNVENISVDSPVALSYTLYVIGSRVNVNAVTAHTNEITQDYALVVSSAALNFAGGLTVSDTPMLLTNYSTMSEPHRFTYLDPGATNAAPLPGQRAGANSPLAHHPTNSLMVITNGTTNQWVFFHVTNSTGGTNAAFITFRPDNVSIPRNDDGDIDLYVSTDSGITNLTPTAIAGSLKSLSRGGTEVIYFTNSASGILGSEFFVGVKSEDQQAVDFGFFAIFTDDRFAERDAFGNITLNALGAPALIPDGTPQEPGGTNVFMINPFEIDIRRVVVTNSIHHQLSGDLVAELEHDGVRATLLNHRGDDTRLGTTYVFDDSAENNVDYPVGPFSNFENFIHDWIAFHNANYSPPQPLIPPNSSPAFAAYYAPGDEATETDGTQRLGNFVGEEGVGLWQYTVSDNQLLHTGFLNGVTIRLEPSNGTNSNFGGGVQSGQINRVRANATYCDFINVPPGAVSLSIHVTMNNPGLAGPLEMRVRRGQLPTTNTYDHFAYIQPPGGTLTITVGDSPALNPGQYFLCLAHTNSSPSEIEFELSFDTEIDFGIVPKVTEFSSAEMEIVDEVRTNGLNAQIPVALSREVAGVRVGIRAEHERASDLAFRLVSPSGTDVLLAENRGWWATNGFGYGTNADDTAYVVFSEDPRVARRLVKFVTNNAFMVYTNPVVLATNYLEGAGGTIASGSISGQDNESVTLIPIGVNAGDIEIDYDFYEQPDRLRIYHRSAGVATLIADTGVRSSLTQEATFLPTDVDAANGTRITNAALAAVISDGDFLRFVSPLMPGAGATASDDLPVTTLGQLNHTARYFALNVDALNGTFEVSDTMGGAALVFTSGGSGTHYVWSGVDGTDRLVRSFTTSYTGNLADDRLEIVVNEGNNAVGTGWDYDYTLNPTIAFANSDQAGTSITAYDGRVFVSGVTDARAQNGILAQFATPMRDDSVPFYSVNWPDLQGGTRFNGVAATASGVFAVGNSYTQTTDPDTGVANKEAKSIVARFPFDDPAINNFDIQGSDFHQQIPADGAGMFSPHQSGGTDYAAEEEAFGITAATENGAEVLYIVGVAPENAANAGRMYLSKMDTSGNFLFHTNDLYNMTADAFSAGYDVAVRGTNVFVAGVNADGGSSNPYIMALDTNGVPQWTWTTNEIGQFNAIVTLNNYIYAVGVIEALSGGAANAFITKLDFSGTVEWMRTYDFNSAGREDVFNDILPFGDRVYVVGAAANSTVPITFSDITANGMDPPGMGMGGGKEARADISLPHDQMGAAPSQSNVRFEHVNVGAANNGITIQFINDPTITTDAARADFGVTAANQLTIYFGNGFTTPNTVLAEVNGNSGTLNFTAAYQGVNNATTPIYANPMTFDRDGTLYAIDENGDLVTLPSAGYNGITVFSGEGNGSDESFQSITTDGFDVYVTGLTQPVSAGRGNELLLVRYLVKEDLLAEESLDAFIGESSAGNWRLEVWDERVGGDTNSSPRLISWQLQLDLTVTNRTPLPLNHTVAVTNEVSGSDTRYFVVHVPFTATTATIDLRSPTGGPIDLFFNQTALPLGGVGSDVLLMNDVDATLRTRQIFTDTGNPPLVPGQRFYLAIQNDPTAATNEFEIEITFDSTATTFAARGGGAIAGASPAPAPQAPKSVDLYQFSVYAGEPKVHVDVKDLSGDVRLRLRRGAVPDASNYDVQVDIVGQSYSRTTLEPGAGIAVLEGTWYAAIENIGETPAAYEVEIIGENAKPALDPIEDLALDEEATVTLTAKATDPNTPLTYKLSSAPTGATIDAQTGAFSWKPTEAQGPATHSVTIQVTDSGIPPLSAFETFQITVNEVNQAPVLPDFGSPLVEEGQTLNLAGGAVDVDVPANQLSYALDVAPAGAIIDPLTGAISWTPKESDGGVPHTFKVTVTDNGAPQKSDTAQFEVAVAEFNSPPVLDPIDDLTMKELTLLRITNVVADADLPANQLLFSLEAGAPAGMTIDPDTGVIDWTPSEAQGPGVYPIGVVVTDNGAPNKDAVQRFEITVAEDNQAPVIGFMPNLLVNENQPLDIVVPVTDDDLPKQVLTHTLTEAPAGMTIDAATGEISWTPTEAQGPGTYAVAIKVEDDQATPLSTTASFEISVEEVNSAPVVRASIPTSIPEEKLLAFTPTVTDVDIPVNQVTFSLGESAPDGAIIDPTTGEFSWTPSEAQGPGVYSIEIHATDDGLPNKTGVLRFTVAVEESNAAPVLPAPGEQTVVEGQVFGYVAAATDADQPANNLTYTLEPGAPAGMTIHPRNGLLQWTPDEVNGATVYHAVVRVTDDGSPALSATRTIEIRVTDGNTAPILGALGDKSVSEGETLEFTATATDADLPTNTLTYSLAGGAPAGATIDPASGLFSWTPSEAQGTDTHQITVTVTDNGNPSKSHSRTFTVSVGDVNRAPKLRAISDVSALEGASFALVVAADDGDVPANNLRFSIGEGAPAGVTIHPSSGLLIWKPAEDQGPGVHTITIEVEDDGVPPLRDAVSFQATITEVNQEPVLAAVGNREIAEGQALRILNSASDADLPVNSLTYSLAPGAPAGMSINGATGSIDWTPTEADGPGEYPVTIIVTDNGEGALSDSETIRITVTEVNESPVLAAIGDQSVAELETLTFTAVASDADEPVNNLEYTLVNAPLGAAIDPVTGVFTWTPTEEQGPGDHAFEVVATDSGDPAASASETVTVSVQEANAAPELAAIGNQSVDENAALSIALSATDADAPANKLTFELLPGAPAGMTLNPDTLELTWTPDEQLGGSEFQVTVRVADDGEGSLSDSETFTIQVVDRNTAPEISGGGNRAIDEGEALTMDFGATDADLPADKLTFSLAPDAPVGMAIDSVSGRLTWTPGESDGGAAHTVTVRVTDDGEGPLADETTFTITVSEVNSAPVFAAVARQTIPEGALRSFAVAATDADDPADKLTYALEPGAPAGVTIDAASGLLSWTPTEAQGPEDYVIHIRVTDDGAPAKSATIGVEVSVTEVNRAPRLLAIGNQMMTECETLNLVVIGLDDDLPAQGLNYRLEPGAPAGASIDPMSGAFSFNFPVGAGSHEITVTVADSGAPSESASATFTVTVGELEPSVVDLQNATAVEGVADACNSFKRVYRFSIPGGATRALFEVYDLTGDVDLLAQRDSAPTGELFDAASREADQTSEKIVIPLGDGSTDISGDWYLVVQNRTEGRAGFKVRATMPQQVNGGSILVSGEPLKVETEPIVSAQSDKPTINFGTVRGEKYVIEVSDDLVNWTILTEFIVTDSNASFVDPTPFLDNSKRFYRIRQVPQ